MAQDRYKLGHKCTVAIDGAILAGVRDIGVRRVTRETDATGWQHNVASSIVTHRSYELEIETLTPADTARLEAAERRGAVVTVTTTDGLRTVSADFTVHDSSADEPLNDAVQARFTLRQWGHAKP